MEMRDLWIKDPADDAVDWTILTNARPASMDHIYLTSVGLGKMIYMGSLITSSRPSKLKNTDKCHCDKKKCNKENIA